MKNYFLLIAALCSPSFLFAQTDVVNSQEKASFSNGLSYSLPKTVLVVEVEAVKTVKLVGPYFRYSERYLGTKEVITDNNTTWSVQSVKVKVKAIPDPANRYVIKPELTSAALFTTLTPNGILYGVNVPWSEPKHCSKSIAVSSTTPDLSFSGAVLNEEALQANSIAKMAELSAKQIYRLRDSRMSLITGDNDKLPDGKALELMLNNIDKSEKELTALFVGKTVEIPSIFTFEVTPEQEMKGEVLFRLSTLTGVVSRDDLSGQPFYITVKDLSDKIVRGEKNSQNGLFYRVPGKADISITDPNGNVVCHLSKTIAQFGTIQSLPANLFNKSTLKLRFDPLTGALLSIEK
jgi:hypothetical protein